MQLDDLTFAPGKPMGGTELQLAFLQKSLPDLATQVQIICSRPEEVTLEDKPRILVLHDLPHDPASQCLKDPDYRAQFNQIVFVSHWQKEQYQQHLGIPFREGIVIKNGIPVIAERDIRPRGADKLRFIYTSTPHRGLSLLSAAANALAEKRQDWELHVYSSLKIYARDTQDAQFAGLYDDLRNNPCVVYHGSQPYTTVRQAVNESHVMVYPSIYPETYCMAAVEALMSGCLLLTSSLGALKEVCGDWAWMMDMTDDYGVLAGETFHAMEAALDHYDDLFVQRQLAAQASFYRQHHSVERRMPLWQALLERVIAEGPKPLYQKTFRYRVP